MLFRSAQGCKHGSMLWQRLQREMPLSLAKTIRVVDSYALGDPSQPLVISAEPSKRYPGNNGAGSTRRNDRPDQRYGSTQVAAMEQEQQDGGYAQRPKNDGPSWGQNRDNQRGFDQNKPSDGRYTYVKMLDGACRYHTQTPASRQTIALGSGVGMSARSGMRKVAQLDPGSPQSSESPSSGCESHGTQC